MMLLREICMKLPMLLPEHRLKKVLFLPYKQEMLSSV